MASLYQMKQPPQRKAFKTKTKKWRKENVDHADNYSLYHNVGVRQTLKNKIINLNLYNGIVNVNDMKEFINPYDIDATYIPDNIPHIPIIVPKIDLLVGEEMNRRDEFKVIVTNPNAITKKENDRKAYILENVVKFLQQNYTDEELEIRMKDLEKFMKYEWQDIREKLANQILNHYWQEQRFDLKFNNGFKNALIMSEEIYQTDIIAGEPVLIELNPLKVRTVRSSMSNRIEDSDLIVLEDHWSPGKIVDTFHESLSPKDIDSIMQYSTRSSRDNYTDDRNNHVLLQDSLFPGNLVDNYLGVAEINGHIFGANYTDSDGNIRVLRVYWRSLKKIKKVKYYDEFGDVQYKFMSEEYTPNKLLGEESKDLWVNEWWEGTKIGEDIYVEMKPKPIQYNRLQNPSKCHPGIIGQVYNTNQGRGVSLIDRAKHYQYLFDGVSDRLNKAIATNHGKIMEVDISKIPAGWEVDKWFHYMATHKIAIIDSFKEGNQGAATGKLAGSMNTQGGRAIDLDTGNYIQQHIYLLEFIKNEMAEICGVSAQRQGQVSNRETKGGVERSVQQSSHVTEPWFFLHDDVKRRALTAFLETAKVALRGKGNMKAQYILDDQTITTLNVDTDLFCEADYGLVATSSSKVSQLEEMMKANAQAMIQNGISVATIMDLYLSPSLMDMRRKIEIAEEEMYARQAKQADDANKISQQEMEYKKQLESRRLEIEESNNIRDNDTKLQIASMGDNVDSDSDGTNDSLEETKMDNDYNLKQKDLVIKMKALNNDMIKHNDKMKLETKKINKMAAKKP